MRNKIAAIVVRNGGYFLINGDLNLKLRWYILFSSLLKLLLIVVLLAVLLLLCEIDRFCISDAFLLPIIQIKNKTTTNYNKIVDNYLTQQTMQPELGAK